MAKPRNRTTQGTKAFWSKVRKAKRGCWLWTGRVNKDGYGIASGKQAAHRLAYQLRKGPISEGMVVRHTCDNRRCVRPDHLKLGSHYENLRDACRRKRLHDPWLIGIVEGGLRMRKKYGHTAEARTRAQLNYKVRKRRRERRQAASVDAITLAQLQHALTSLDGCIECETGDGQVVRIPIGARRLCWDQWVEDPILKRPSRSPETYTPELRKALLRKYEEVLSTVGQSV